MPPKHTGPLQTQTVVSEADLLPSLCLTVIVIVGEWPGHIHLLHLSTDPGKAPLIQVVAHVWALISPLLQATLVLIQCPLRTRTALGELLPEGHS